MKIRTKLFIFPIIIILTLSISLIIITLTSNNTIKDEIANHLFTIAKYKVANIKTILNNYKNITLTLASENIYTDTTNKNLDFCCYIEQYEKIIGSKIINYPEIESVQILNKTGIILASSDTTEIGMDKSNDPLYLLGSKKLNIGEIHKSKITKIFKITVSTPIFVEHKFSGVLAVNFRVHKFLYKLLTNKTGLGKSGESYLVNKDHSLISPTLNQNNIILKTKINTEQKVTELYLSLMMKKKFVL